jgi:hypothetical protein
LLGVVHFLATSLAGGQPICQCRAAFGLEEAAILHARPMQDRMVFIDLEYTNKTPRSLSYY